MKRFGMLATMALVATIGGVYATWFYSQTEDVADISGERVITMTGAEFTGGYGKYDVAMDGVSLLVDPKEGTSHTTALYITGDVVITFTPDKGAPVEVKNDGVATTYTLSIPVGYANTYNTQTIITVDGTAQNATWQKQADGTFTHTITADKLTSMIGIAEFVLDTKAEYDAFATALQGAQILVSVSDGKTSTP